MNQNELIEIAQLEISLNRQDEEIWKKCLVLTDHNIIKAKEKYIRQRVIQFKKLDTNKLHIIKDSLKKSRPIDTQNEQSKPTTRIQQNTNEAILKHDNLKEPKTSNWFAWIIFVIVVILFFIGTSGNNQTSKTQYSSTTTTQPSTNYTGNQQRSTYSTDTSKGPASTSTTYKEEKPSIIGLNTILTLPQLRYCLAEKIRTSKSFEFLDQSNQEQMRQYNHSVDEFNSRCAQARYYENDMKIASKEIEERKQELEEDGKNRFYKPLKNSKEAMKQLFDNTTVPSKSGVSLTILATPSDATIKILNISPKYYAGILLDQGKYHIEVSRKGYKPVRQWVDLQKNESIKITLEEEMKLTQEELNILQGKTNTNIVNSQNTNLSAKEDCVLKGGDWQWNSSVNGYQCSKRTANSNITISSTNPKGLEIYKAKCYSCHGEKASKSALNKSQIIAGWNSSRIISSINGYKNGEGGTMKGVMKPIASGLSNDDLNTVADTISKF